MLLGYFFQDVFSFPVRRRYHLLDHGVDRVMNFGVRNFRIREHFSTRNFIGNIIEVVTLFIYALIQKITFDKNYVVVAAQGIILLRLGPEIIRSNVLQLGVKSDEKIS